MAILQDLVKEDSTTVLSRHEGRKHLQRLIRKVRHVLIVKHCIDDLRISAELRRLRDKCLRGRDDPPNELPATSVPPPSLTDDLERAATEICTRIRRTDAASFVDDQPAKIAWKQPLKTLGLGVGLSSLETVLDRYIAHSYDFARKCRQNVINSGRDAWISWAKKRGSCVRDYRSQAILVKLLKGAEQELEKLYTLQWYLDAYVAGSYGRALERLSEVVTRLRTVFGIGWFFEWPSGQHPLNSTWPWADVKPSLLVLWGVCWMFFPANWESPDRPAFDFNDQNLGQSNVGRRRPMNRSPPIGVANMAFSGRLLPAQQPANSGRMSQPRIHAPPMPIVPRSGFVWDQGPQAFSQSNAINFGTHNPPQPSHFNSAGPSTPWNEWQHLRIEVPNGYNFGSGHSRHRTRDVAEPESWLSRNLLLPDTPQWLGENSDFKAATSQFNDTSSIHNLHLLPLYESTLSFAASMPPSTSFTYPSLDNMAEMHDSQPYMGEHGRVYPMPEYEQHHDVQQDQPRYPTPPPPLSENPYNQQQGNGDAPDGRMDMPMETKSESDAPSPGRSKPIPKPDREVTKDANGRFYCTWQGCTEEVKDFGRKCEWSKHMDKHDRPYKCPADGCEKLPGFTYSGGLLRHEREVHNKHGGPRKQLNCPHPNCKRHTGKGFSRQENLNEHLRRVHTDAGVPVNGEETEDDGSEAQPGGKRKRLRGDSADLREEMKRLKQENEELRRQAEAQTAQSADMMRQIMQLQQAQQLQATMQHPRMQAPPAQMT